MIRRSWMSGIAMAALALSPAFALSQGTHLGFDTNVYPGDKAPGFWDLLSGAVPKVIIDIQVRELDPALWSGDYENDPLVRQAVQDWVNTLWHDKDQRIEALRAELG